MVPGDGTKVLQRCGEYTYKWGELRGRVGKERGGKEMDGCSLTYPTRRHLSKSWQNARMKLGWVM
jgi:hypothetical protein